MSRSVQARCTCTAPGIPPQHKVAIPGRGEGGTHTAVTGGSHGTSAKAARGHRRGIRHGCTRPEECLGEATDLVAVDHDLLVHGLHREEAPRVPQLHQMHTAPQHTPRRAPRGPRLSARALGGSIHERPHDSVSLLREAWLAGSCGSNLAGCGGGVIPGSKGPYLPVSPAPRGLMGRKCLRPSLPSLAITDWMDSHALSCRLWGFTTAGCVWMAHRSWGACKQPRRQARTPTRQAPGHIARGQTCRALGTAMPGDRGRAAESIGAAAALLRGHIPH